MVFSSTIFLVGFLPFVLAGYFLSPRRYRNAYLIGASLCFYVWGEREYGWVLPLSIVGNYLAGVWIARSRYPMRVLAAAVAANLLLLAAFKYANFLADNLNFLLLAVGLRGVRLNPVHLPCGISFFTFQAISYLVDVSRHDVPVERSPTRYALYAALFPHLIAGPIVRYRDLANRLGDRIITPDGFAEGVRRFVIGLGKKVLLANTVATAADDLFGLPPAVLGTGAAWLGLACYSLQIYFDFSGYSDMAIGLGKMFGFDFAENFRHPYAAASVTDFWRRWHITLSSWLRDYVYIPLGGSRCSPARVLGNLVIVFVLCGLWHGAAWTFLVWGLWHGAFLVAERVGLGRALEALPRPFRHAYTLLAVMGGWVLFRADSFPHAAGYFAALFGRGAGASPVWAYAGRDVWIALAVGCIACLPVGPWLGEQIERRRTSPAWGRWREASWAAAEFAGYSGMLFASVLCLAAGTYNPFLYFRF
jgi:alginate O-acetyltransferase complex protein AlgI